MNEVRKYSKSIRIVCGLLAMLGAAAMAIEIVSAEDLSFHFKYIAIPFALFIFGFVAIKGENPMRYLEKFEK